MTGHHTCTAPVPFHARSPVHISHSSTPRLRQWCTNAQLSMCKPPWTQPPWRRPTAGQHLVRSRVWQRRIAAGRAENPPPSLFLIAANKQGRRVRTPCARTCRCQLPGLAHRPTGARAAAAWGTGHMGGGSSSQRSTGNCPIETGGSSIRSGSGQQKRAVGCRCGQVRQACRPCNIIKQPKELVCSMLAGER